MGKHAYLILAHKNFNQLRKLIELLDDERNDIYLHVDAKAKEFNPSEWHNITTKSRLNIITDRMNVNWGGVSGMLSEILLLKTALADGPHDYYHLLSGMDLPLKSQNEIHAFFDKNQGKEFINLWNFKKSTYSRFQNYTLFPEGESKFLPRLANHIFKGLQMAVGYRINRKIKFGYGANWFSITQGLSEYVVNNKDWLLKVFKHTSNSDELFLQTLIIDTPFADNLYIRTPAKNPQEVNLSHMRFIDWTRGESVRHPWTFRVDDMELLESVPHFWARKFDEGVDAEIIDMIYNRLKNKDGK